MVGVGQRDVETPGDLVQHGDPLAGGGSALLPALSDGVGPRQLVGNYGDADVELGELVAAGLLTVVCQGAATSVFAATSPLLADIGGVYLQNSDIAPLEDIDEPISVEFGAGPFQTTVGVTRYAVDPESAQRLWGISEKLLTA